MIKSLRKFILSSKIKKLKKERVSLSAEKIVAISTLIDKVMDNDFPGTYYQKEIISRLDENICRVDNMAIEIRKELDNVD